MESTKQWPPLPSYLHSNPLFSSQYVGAPEAMSARQDAAADRNPTLPTSSPADNVRKRDAKRS